MSLGTSTSDSDSDSSSYLNSTQEAALAELYQLAIGNVDSGTDYESLISSLSDTGASSITDAISSLSDASDYLSSGGAYGDTSQYISTLMSLMGEDSAASSVYSYLLGGGDSTYTDNLISQLQSDAADNVATLMNENSTDAAMAGQSGSSRQALENAMITSEGNEDLLTAEAQLRADAYDTDIANQLYVASQADANTQAQYETLLSLISGSQESTTTAATDVTDSLTNLVDSLTSVYDDASSSEWYDLQNLASIIGSAILEGTSSSTSTSKGSGFSLN